MKAPSSKAAEPVVEWNCVFLLFGHSWLFLKSKGFFGMLHLRYISRIQFFFIHSILTRPSEEGVTDQEGMSVNIDLRPTKVKNRKFSKKIHKVAPAKLLT